MGEPGSDELGSVGAQLCIVRTPFRRRPGSKEETRSNEPSDRIQAKSSSVQDWHQEMIADGRREKEGRVGQVGRQDSRARRGM